MQRVSYEGGERRLHRWNRDTVKIKKSAKPATL